MSFGNGTAWGGNTFNNRTADLSNYELVRVRISATDPNGGGGELGMNAFMQTNNFQFNGLEGGAGRNLPIDGQFHTLTWPVEIAGGLPVPNANATDNFSINLFGHAQNLDIRVDWVRFVVPEPASMALVCVTMLGSVAMFGRRRE